MRDLVLGICEACNSQFKSNLSDPSQADLEIRANFDQHKCKPLGTEHSNYRRNVRSQGRGDASVASCLSGGPGKATTVYTS